MRTRILERAQPKIHGVVMMIDSQAWCWLAEKKLWTRLTTPVPAKYLHKPDGAAVTFIRAACKAVSRAPALPVVRGDHLTIGSLTIKDEAMVDHIDEEFSGVTWHPWNGWLLARDAAGKVVAIWKLPPNQGLIEAFVVELDGDPWISDGHFAMRTRPSLKERKAMLATARRAPEGVAKLKAAMVDAAQGYIASPSASANGTSTIGATVVPTLQVRIIERVHGADLEWRWTTPEAPVVAFAAGRAVGIIMPFPKEQP